MPKFKLKSIVSKRQMYRRVTNEVHSICNEKNNDNVFDQSNVNNVSHNCNELKNNIESSSYQSSQENIFINPTIDDFPYESEFNDIDNAVDIEDHSEKNEKNFAIQLRQ